MQSGVQFNIATTVSSHKKEATRGDEMKSLS